KDFILRFSNTEKEDIYSRNYQTEFFRKNALLNFVPFGRGFNKDFISFYAQHFTDRNKRKELVQQMKLFIPDIEEIDSATLNIYQTGSSAPTPLSQFGEGANKLFRVIMQLAAAQGSRLMIDEIDAGVHRYKFHSFWQTVIKVARHYDVQLFATTHNIECVEQFYLALQDPDMETYQNAARTLTLYKTTKNEVAVRTRNYKEFGEAITDERNIMGGD
ncbi:MAG TPA: AAA family ATPase, partial [Chitinophagales bacterium]|nr:AAA family ATPase [Chitinophagales bacterium]